MNEFDFIERKIIFEKPKRVLLPLSWVQHIPFSFYLVSELNPKIIVELGTHSGNSLCAFAQINQQLQQPGICYAIDSWEGDLHSGSYDISIYNDLRNYCFQNYSNTVLLIKKYFDEAILEFNDNSIDLLHIDGLHTYNAVKHDFETWKNKLSPNGIVLFHDTQVKTSDFGVYALWNEISKNYPSFEFKFGNGLGVLFVGKKYLQSSENKILDFISNKFNYELFRSLGLNIDLEYQLIASKKNEKKYEEDLNKILESKSYKYLQTLKRVFK